MTKTQKNIVLIGMPAVGKSTIGVILAKRLGRHFLDTDICIQAITNRSLQEIIDTDGLNKFCQIESDHICCIDKTNSVIATGGSAVYSDTAMNHLKQNGIIIHLDLPLEQIKKRLTNLNVRGVVMQKQQTLEDLYESRNPLYKKWADITINCTNLTQEQLVEKIIKNLS